MQGRTQWSRGIGAPLRAFLRTESGSAGVLVAAIAVALIWANVDVASYERLWSTDFAVRFGAMGITEDLRTWVNSGLMTLFFLVVGLEARREFDLGDLRDRRRFVLPFAGRAGRHAHPGRDLPGHQSRRRRARTAGASPCRPTPPWRSACWRCSARAFRTPVRVFLLTVFVVDDLVALLVIAVVYSEDIKLMPLLIAVAAFGVWLLLRTFNVRRAFFYAAVGIVLWAAMLASGVDPVVAGLAIGLTAVAYTPARETLEAASGLFKLFREQPTPELARSAAVG